MSRECQIEFEHVDSASLTGKLVGQKVTWKNGNSRLVGKIVSPHGRNGMVRVKVCTWGSRPSSRFNC